MENKPDTDFNPYATPEYEEPSLKPMAPVEMAKPKPCPSCGGENATPVPYSAWYGRRAPKAIQELRCDNCGCEFDGETGKAYPARKNPVVWFVIALFLFLAYVAFLVALSKINA